VTLRRGDFLWSIAGGVQIVAGGGTGGVFTGMYGMPSGGLVLKSSMVNRQMTGDVTTYASFLRASS
jgi:hypothetical protein